MPVVWRDQLNTGNDAIDKDHRYLFCLFNSVELALSHADLYQHLPLFFSQMVDYTREHFVREETVQVKIGYPAHAEHRHMHQQIVRDLEAAQRRIQDLLSTEGTDPAHLRQELLGQALLLAREWVIDHVIKVDREMIPYLKPYDRKFE